MDITKNLIVGTEEFMISLWDKFDEIMDKEGYELIINTDNPSLTRGTICFNSKDKYIPIISLHLWNDTQLSIFVEDRNGNAVITGNTVLINSLKFTKEDIKEDIEKRFENMIDYTLERYKNYNKQNRLDFDVDEKDIERIEW